MSSQISDERLAELMSQFEKEHKRMQVLGYHTEDQDIFESNADTAAALRELQRLRACHREVICRRCGLRDQLAQESPLPEPQPLF